MPRFAFAVLLALSFADSAWAGQRVLHESTSMFGRLTVTDEGGGLRSLRFEPGGLIQSQVRIGRPLELHFDYLEASLASLALVEAPKRILVVGLGGGAMPMFLHRVFPAARIDAVEIDPEVIRVSRRYFGFREGARVRAHAMDGREFVRRSDGGYDLIFLDAFGSADIPRHLATLEFLELVRDRLSPSGVVVGNVFEPTVNPLFSAMRRTYAAAFDQLCVLEVPMAVNRIFLARRRGASSIDADLAARVPGLAARLRLPYRIERFTARGCMRVAEKGEILRDPDATAPAPAAAP